MNKCYCGKDKSYNNCCGTVHKDILKASTAEDLMRSRYSAFVLTNGDYLMKSHHSTTRPLKEKKSIVTWAKSVNWVKLEVLNTTDGLEYDMKGTVEFKAFYFEKNKIECIHENSAFIKENGYWVYLGEA
ncbi:Sec-C motif domain protein [Aquimarina sp. MMG015]|uniref:YchJ family protein n=1 Tax=unclassified Aquimarina TaxID=2627091 RepID=UPI000E516F3B|nr:MULTISPECIES: YchJ family metal-binding protein [unclassified Aquimarina]AXT55272.1 Sec-C motif domain protein [Aquimarina sp. AD1]MBQ4802238.1 Sec-C motif domain protein [Aquimarina sp. MMG015]RKN04588.1 Sec-C motif domain protein [Aquimarina sp. AD1]